MAADFTGDGLDDLLVALGNWPTTEQYQVQLLVNDGAGHLVNGTSSVFQGHIPETVFPYKTVVADFNGDKIADLFIADTGEDVANPRGWYSPLILSAPGGYYLGAIVEVDAKTEILWPAVRLTDIGEESLRETPDHVDVLGKTRSGALFTADINAGVAPEDVR